MIVNLTPHPITLRAANGAETTINPRSAAEGGAARVTSTPGALASVDGIPVPVASATTFGEVAGLPAPHYECGCGNGAECPAAFRLDMAGALECPHYVVAAYYVVSGIVGAALRATGSTRRDVLCPGTGPNDGAVRNEAGHIVAVTRLVQP
jgi:hypothetical protein